MMIAHDEAAEADALSAGLVGRGHLRVGVCAMATPRMIMRRYFASIVITIGLGSMAIWQVAWHREWVLVAWIVVCIGFHWWWTDRHACR